MYACGVAGLPDADAAVVATGVSVVGDHVPMVELDHEPDEWDCRKLLVNAPSVQEAVVHGPAV